MCKICLFICISLDRPALLWCPYAPSVFFIQLKTVFVWTNIFETIPFFWKMMLAVQKWHTWRLKPDHWPHLRTGNVHHTRHCRRDGVIARLVWLGARLSISYTNQHTMLLIMSGGYYQTEKCLQLASFAKPDHASPAYFCVADIGWFGPVCRSEKSLQLRTDVKREGGQRSDCIFIIIVAVRLIWF